MAQNQVYAVISVGLETIAAAKGPGGLMVAVMERLGEQLDIHVPHGQVSPRNYKLITFLMSLETGET